MNKQAQNVDVVFFSRQNRNPDETTKKSIRTVGTVRSLAGEGAPMRSVGSPFFFARRFLLDLFYDFFFLFAGSLVRFSN